MRFKRDENMPTEAAGLLRNSGHDAHSVYDEELGGADDQSIAQAIPRERRVLITLDLDFADIRRYPSSVYHGIIVLRLTRQDRDSILTMIPRLLELLRTESIAQRLRIVGESRTRIREA